MIRSTLMVLLLALSTLAFGQNNRKGDFAADGSSEGWTLGSGTGTRSYILFVKFEKPYDTAPTVLLSLTGHSGAAGKEGQINVGVTAEKVTRDGFVIKVSTWGDSKIHQVHGSWLAFGK